MKKFVNSKFSREEVKHIQLLKDAEMFMEKSKHPKKVDDEIKEKIEESGLTKDIMEVGKKEDKEGDMPSKKLRAIVLLQRLIKGRNEQNKMYEGREKRRDLI